MEMFKYTYPTLLKTPLLPVCVDDDVEWTWPPEHVVPHPPEAYVIVQGGTSWQVRLKTSQEVVYDGPGPVELIAYPAPF